MPPPFLQLCGVSLKGVGALEPLLPNLVGPFWRAGPPAKTAADYADGLEDLITDYNQQHPAQLIAWARQHPLTPEERFILEYNTSIDRANVIRPLPLDEKTRVLEIGCGCGPVSQYLWARCPTVSIEASSARAGAAAHRLTRHPNPHGSVLLCADFHQLEGKAAFDWVIINGVLEYAAIYSGARESTPYAAMLRRAAEFLKPGGRCVVTIENRLGLKYFAGAPEDHYGRGAVGLEGYCTLGPKPAPIRTFSKPALSRLLAESGFPETSYFFPFPDYKFAKVILPDDGASWQFATERLLEAAPAWRSPREFGFDEPAAFRTLAADGLAAEFAHSFLVVATKPGSKTGAPLPTCIHYLPLGRNPHTAAGTRFDLTQHQVLRRRLDGGHFTVHACFPPHAPGNPLARFTPPANSPDGTESMQPLSPAPTLWEGFRHQLGHTIDSPEIYAQALEGRLAAMLGRHLSCLPFQPNGDWPVFIARLQREFVQGGLGDSCTRLLNFLQAQQPFAEHSLRQMTVPGWSMWAPDWILENLFPSAEGQGLAFFDMEYVDVAACLPTPALAFRQLRIMQAKSAGPALAACWPWPTCRLQLQTSRTDLPVIAFDLTVATLWKNIPAQDINRHAWFWSKVAEMIECAMTSTVVAPLTKAYETAPWLEKLSAELTLLADTDLTTAMVDYEEISTLTAQHTSQAHLPDELIVKEQQINRLAAISKERELSLVESSAEADRLRIDAANLTTELKAKERDLLAAHAEMKQLATTAGQRERSLLESSAEADRLRVSAATLTAELLAKEAVIRDLVRACDERLQLINKLTAGQDRGPQ